ncbi:hypothetical protein AgCh_009483 [Apium graveolens]
MIVTLPQGLVLKLQILEIKLATTQEEKNKDPINLILSDPESGVKTRRATSNECFYSGFLSQMEPKKVDEALGDSDWVIAMQEELNQFEIQKVSKLVPGPKDKSVIGTKWFLEIRLMNME